MIYNWIFRFLSEGKKLSFLKKHGLYVGEKSFRDKTCEMYLLGKSYVEVVYKNQVLSRIRLFSSITALTQSAANDFTETFNGQ